MNRNTVKDIKASYERLKVGKKGKKLERLKGLALMMYIAVQRSELN